MVIGIMNKMTGMLGGSVTVTQNTVRVNNPDRLRLEIYRLAEVSALGSEFQAGWAQYLVRKIAEAMGIYPASIQELYSVRGSGEIPLTFTVPALNLRVLSFDAARAAFRAALSMDAAALIFEIARAEMAFTDQRPAEYATSVLSAAVAEGYRGPVFIQGDHFQVSAKRYASEPEKELEDLRALMRESVSSGFYNIDVDASTLVDLNQPDVPGQQNVNAELTAMFTRFLRFIEPEGVTISIGGEIGEVGGHNSTEEELRAFLDGYGTKLQESSGSLPGLSKLSIQTGTSHGGIVLPDGSIAEMKVDFDTMRRLGRIARSEYGLGGVVQHGASTLPESAFGHFIRAEACEIHLATSFMNLYYEHIPEDLREEMYAALRKTFGAEHKERMTDEQFYNRYRKFVVGAFKEPSWRLDGSIREMLRQAWEAKFKKMFRLLGLEGTRQVVDQTVQAVMVPVESEGYTGVGPKPENIGDLAD